MPRTKRVSQQVGTTTAQRAVVAELAKGEFTGVAASNTAITVNQDAERALLVLGSSSNRVLIPWLRMKYWLWNSSYTMALRWFLYKSQSITPSDMSDYAVVEGLQRDKRILARGAFVQNSIAENYRPISFEKYAIALEEGEYLHLTVINESASRTGCEEFYEVEYRQIEMTG